MTLVTPSRCCSRLALPTNCLGGHLGWPWRHGVLELAVTLARTHIQGGDPASSDDLRQRLSQAGT